MPMNPAELFHHDSDVLELAAGQPLFREGECGEEMYVVLEGSLAIIVAGKVVEVATAGTLLGELALIDSAPRAATVLAKAPCRLARIDRARFHFLIQQTPMFATHVMKVLADRIRQMNETLMNERLEK
jgi:CRP-like cAMP-binding protein